MVTVRIRVRFRIVPAGKQFSYQTISKSIQSFEVLKYINPHKLVRKKNNKKIFFFKLVQMACSRPCLSLDKPFNGRLHISISLK